MKKDRTGAGKVSYAALRAVSCGWVLCALFAAACAGKQAERTDTVVVMTYDSFTSEWGPGAACAANFFDATGITVVWDSFGDAGEMLARLLLDGEGTKADIVLGLDQNLAPRALAAGLLQRYKPLGAEIIFDELNAAGADFMLIPFDYSYFAVIYDSEAVKTPPRSLEALCGEAFQNKLILMDPRTSSPGLGFLSWTIAEYGAQWRDYWRRLLPSILTIAPGWDMGYGLFTKGEAPLVLSYTTSPAYHLEYEGNERYRAAIFDSGHPVQIEYAGLLRAAPHEENARRFLDFMLSEGFQREIPLGNWMYPVTDIPLPPSFRAAVKSSRTLYGAPVSEEQLEQWADVVRAR